MAKENLEVYKELAEQFDNYLVNVRRTCMQTLKENEGTRHEAAARTAAQFASDLYNRWENAYQAAIDGATYEFPNEITVEKEELPKNEE